MLQHSCCRSQLDITELPSKFRHQVLPNSLDDVFSISSRRGDASIEIEYKLSDDFLVGIETWCHCFHIEIYLDTLLLGRHSDHRYLCW